MEDFNVLISKIPDENIYHIFVYDIIRYYTANINTIIITDGNMNKNSKCQLWRIFVFEKLYPNVNIQFIHSINEVSKKTYNGFSEEQVLKINDPLDSHLCEIINKINSKCKGEYILINQRNYNNRYLFDFETQLPLQDYLLTKQFKYPVKACCFDTMTPQEQYDICSKAKIFISAHGAGCTNLIFTPIDCPLIEINFRKHWYCDNVCDDHFFGKISINEKCNGTLNYLPHFHKLYFCNMSYLINKKYTEIEAVCYGGKFTNRNPISKQQIYIDGEKLSKIIEEYIEETI